MKILIPFFIAVLVVGCGKKNAPESKTGQSATSSEFARQSFLGIYESEDSNDWIYRLVLKEDGSYQDYGYQDHINIYQDYINGLALADTGMTWKVVGKELHVGRSVYTLNADNGLVNIAMIGTGIRDKGTREDLPTKEQRVLKKIKAETQPKTFKALKEEDVVGTYTNADEHEGGSEKFIFLKNGVVESFINDKKTGHITKWKINGSAIWTISKLEYFGYIYKKEQNGDLSEVSAHQGSHIMPHSIKERTTYKKFKSEKETSSKGDDNNSTTENPVKKLTLEEKVVGEYQIKEGESSRRLVLLDNGFAESYTNGKKEDRNGKWKISKEGEIHVTDPDGGIIVCRINKDGSITGIAEMDDGKREDLPKEQQVTAKKIK